MAPLPFERDNQNVYQKEPDTSDEEEELEERAEGGDRVANFLVRMLRHARTVRHENPDVQAAYERDIRRRRLAVNEPPSDESDGENDAPRPRSPLITWPELLAELDRGVPPEDRPPMLPPVPPRGTSEERRAAMRALFNPREPAGLRRGILIPGNNRNNQEDSDDEPTPRQNPRPAPRRSRRIAAATLMAQARAREAAAAAAAAAQKNN